MQFLAISRTRTDLFNDADFAPLLEDEAQRARTLYIEGAVRQIWYRGDERGACSLLEGLEIPSSWSCLHLELLPCYLLYAICEVPPLSELP